MSYKVHKACNAGTQNFVSVTKLLLTLCLLSITLLGFGQVFTTLGEQNKEFIRKNFKDNGGGLRRAKDSIKKGDIYYKMGSHYYRYAIPYYMSAEVFNPNNAMLNYKIGKCMIYSPLKSQASYFLEKAIRLNPMLVLDIHYYLGRAYHLSSKWDSAQKEYSTYLNSLAPVQAAEIDDVRKKISECDNGRTLSQNPLRVFIDNVGASVNTKYPEYHPLVNADETELIYTSRVPANSKSKIDPTDGQTYEDIFVSNFKNGAWTTAASLGTPVDTKSHDATAGLSADGQTLYIYRTKDNGDLYQTHLANNVWTKPVRMNDKINSAGKETSITSTSDGKVFYFVSDRPGGYGYGDIYKVVTDGNGTWGDPQNLGPTINTQYDEAGVSLSADGNTLYFSSMGHNTMGGYDVFKTEFSNGQWSEPVNLGYPVNSPDDDVFYVVPANKKHAYYSSCRKSGSGDMDIFMITYLGADKTMMASISPNTFSGITTNITDVMMSSAVSLPEPEPVVSKVMGKIKDLLKVMVVDSETHKPLFATIKLVDNRKNIAVATFTTDSITGRYDASLSSGINYGIAVSADHYLFYSANIDLTDSVHYREIEKDIALQPLEVGSHIALRNIFFDFGKSTIRKESAPELQRVIDMLVKYPTLTIEIAGYTDNVGTVAANLALSSARAKSVVTYLTLHGIAAKRMTSKGYGADNPVATNTTDQGRQLNRRTEFKITGK